LLSPANFAHLDANWLPSDKILLGAVDLVGLEAVLSLTIRFVLLTFNDSANV